MGSRFRSATVRRRFLASGPFLGLAAGLLLTSGALKAQDVIALPQSADAPAPQIFGTSPTTPDAPLLVRDPASAQAQQSVTQPVTTATASTAAPVTATPGDKFAALNNHPPFDLVFLSCTTDADCTPTDDGCTTLAAVNKAYVKNWKAVMTHDPACVPAYDQAKVSLIVKATCREGWCGLQPKVSP